MSLMISEKSGSTAFDVTDKGVAIKQYTQQVSGSTYMKLPFHVMEIHQAGYRDIIIEFTGSWQAANKFSDTIKMVKQYMPDLNINLRLVG